MGPALVGEHFEVPQGSALYPPAFERLKNPPETLYCIGNPAALREGIAVVGARKATPYGISCATRFSRLAAQHGVVVISGGAYGCDSAAHKAAIDVGGCTIAFLGGGCDCYYPVRHGPLFQAIIDAGGLVVSEHVWDYPAQPYTFLERNRLIAALGRATLVVEAGIPSGTFSTADNALNSGRDVLAVPGAITSPMSAGANMLISQGATPVVSDEVFLEALCTLFPQELAESGFASCFPYETGQGDSDAIHKPDEATSGSNKEEDGDNATIAIIDALRAEIMDIDSLYQLVDDALSPEEARKCILAAIKRGEELHFVQRYPGGRYGPYLDSR